MRASATSRISHQTTLHATQAADANKADEASPFALLLQSTAAKPQANGKDAQDDKADGKADDRKSDAKADSKADTGNATTQTANQAQLQTKPAKSDKAGKSDKASDKAGTIDANPAQPAASQQPATPPPPVPPSQLALAATAAAVTNGNGNGDEEDGSDAVSGAAAANAAGQAQGSQTTDQLAGLAAAASAKPADTAKPGDDENTDPVADLKAASKPGAPQTPSQAASDATTKAASAKDSDAKADALKTADAQPAQPAPQPVNSAPVNSNVALHSTAAPVTQTAAPTITQHVEVTAQSAQTATAPNLPALAVAISAKSQSGSKQFDIRLDPPELGHVEVRLSIDSTGKASAHLSADQPQTLDLLQKDAPALQRALRDAGLDVSQNGLNFSLRQQTGDGGNTNNSNRGNARGAFALTATSSTEATAASAAYRAPADGRLDIRV